MVTHDAAVPQLPLATTLTGSRAYARPLLVVAGVLLLTVSAKLQIPLWPVPMTMQTYVILVIGMAYGTSLGVLTVGAYLVAGAVGLPVFAGTPGKGIGLAYMVGPTGGYLLGFMVATSLLSKLAEKGWDRRMGSSFVLLGWERAIAVGVTPFITATIIKTILAGFTLPVAWRWVRRLR